LFSKPSLWAAVLLLLLTFLCGHPTGQAVQPPPDPPPFNIYDWYGYGEVWDDDVYIGEFYLYPAEGITGGLMFDCYFEWADGTWVWFDVRALWTTFGDLSFQGATIQGYGVMIQNGVIHAEDGSITGIWQTRVGDTLYFGDTVDGWMYPVPVDDIDPPPPPAPPLP
jgi:hypothetical protein